LATDGTTTLDPKAKQATGSATDAPTSVAEEPALAGDATSIAELLEPPISADAGLLIIHGAGQHHEPGSSIHELLNPTFDRLRQEGNLLSVRPFVLGSEELPGGSLDGLSIDYLRHGTPLDASGVPEGGLPSVDETIEAAKRARRVMVLEARWIHSFRKTRTRDVSAWAATRVARMMSQVWLYQWRSAAAGIVALASVGLIFAGIWYAGNTALSLGLLLSGFLIACIGGIADLLAPWNARDEGVPPGRWYVRIPAALTLTIYQVQRGFVLVVVFIAIPVLPLLSGALRLLATIPGLNAISRGLLATVEAFFFAGPASDIETISSNYPAASAIQSRIRAALVEVESRVKAGGTITVLAHSAGGPLAWWLLSEPEIHLRQERKPLKYRLITVGAALNWAKRGMDTEATPLQWPLVHSDGNPSERTLWANVYSIWDPAPHGPIVEAEYAPGWAVWEQTRPEPPNALAKRSWRTKAISIVSSIWTFGSTSKRDTRNSPNLVTRNLGSPVSAEHSEYFRNQQEFVPVLVRAMDAGIDWATKESRPLLHRQWANARLALISGLVRLRMAMFAIPIAVFFSAIIKSRVFSSCADQRADIRSPDGAPFIGAAGRYVGEQMSRVASWVPGVSDDASCDLLLIE
jgi:hypothetical protein